MALIPTISANELSPIHDRHGVILLHRYQQCIVLADDVVFQLTDIVRVGQSPALDAIGSIIEFDEGRTVLPMSDNFMRPNKSIQVCHITLRLVISLALDDSPFFEQIENLLP